MTDGELKEAKNATCWLLIPCALWMNKFGKPSGNDLRKFRGNRGEQFEKKKII